MAVQNKSDFVHSRLPWIIAAAALAVYLLTLNRWVSLSGLSLAADVASQQQLPPLGQPLRFLMCLPFRWLPVGWQPVALNAFSALCASLTLGLLARSVALLPQDRTRDQRQRQRSEFAPLSIPAAWAPPLFGALACGLQLSFWEHATAATGEMFDLLLFAYVVRCLLEFRIDQRESWLMRSALVYGIAATNNYAMIGFFPAYLIALIWIKGLSFFEFRFLARMFGWGAAGLTLYLLLPLLHASSGQTGLSFWQALRSELAGQKNALLTFPRLFVAFAGLTSLVPLLLIGIRWPSALGETSPVGATLTALLFRVVHGAFLAAGIWVAFDARGSIRWLIESRLQEADQAPGGAPYLTFYYLGAVCLGYFIGYFLLVFGRDMTKTWQRSSSTTRLVNHTVTGAAWMVMIGAPAGLLYKNVPIIRANDGTLLRDFARLTTAGLPAQGAVALSDEPIILSLAQQASQQAGMAREQVLADTRLMSYPIYQQLLHRRFPQRWPETPPAETPTAAFDRRYLMYEVSELVRSNAVYYLHPSFGYYFELLYLRPHGLVYHLAPYGTNLVTPPALTDALIHENQKFWADARPALEGLSALVRRRISEARVIGRWYSRALNWWGVELQKLGRLEDAAQAFALAGKLNPKNVAAELNFGFNQTLRAGAAAPAETNKALEERLGRYRTWDALLAVNGPIDEPRICLRLGETFAAQTLFRQAAMQFMRVAQLEPDNLDARFWLANVFLAAQSPDKALEVASEIRAQKNSRPLSSTNLVELDRIEAMAHFSKGDFETAERTLLNARQRHPHNETLFDTLIQVYVRANRLTNALAVVDEELKRKPDQIAALLNRAYLCLRLVSYDQANAAVAAVLKKDPDNVQALLDRAAICIQTKSYQDALEPLNQVLKLQPNNEVALMNRSIAYLQSDQLDAAQRDYEVLQKRSPTLFRVQYGLGEIAFRRKDTSAAIKHYETYLKYAPPGTEEAKQIAERLKQLKASGGR